MDFQKIEGKIERKEYGNEKQVWFIITFLLVVK